ncbi:toprim domain-containing protein [Kitasatospora sp. NPDC003701]
MTEILARFTGVEDAGRPGEYLALCPGHGDRSPSLWFNLHGGGMLGVKCRAGCATSDVLACVGLRFADLRGVDAGGLAVAPAARPERVGVRYVAGLRVWLDRLPSAAGLPYAVERFGLSDAQAEALDLRRWDPIPEHPDWIGTRFARFPRLVVPLAGFDGVTRGAQGRDLSGRCPGRWLSLSNPDGAVWSKLGHFPANPSREGLVVVTEGPGDALSVCGAGVDAVAVRGASLGTSLELLGELIDGLRGRDVVLAGDGDAAGRLFVKSLAVALAREGIECRVLRRVAGRDLTDLRAENPERFRARLARELERAKPAPFTVAERREIELERFRRAGVGGLIL